MEERINILWFGSGQLKPSVYTLLNLVWLLLLGTGKAVNARMLKEEYDSRPVRTVTKSDQKLIFPYSFDK